MSDWLMASGCIEDLTAEETDWWLDQEFYSADVEEHDGGKHLVFEGVPQDDELDLLKEFFKLFRPNDCVTITWSCQSGSYCGGGACLISADTYLWNHVGEWAAEQAETFRLSRSAK